MTTKFLTGFERDTIQQAYECVSCLEPITNPLCHDCLGNQISSWLGLYPNIRKKLTPKLKSYIQEVNNNTINSVTCVSCNKKKAALCPYCFTEGIFNLLKKSNIDKMVIMDFLSRFKARGLYSGGNCGRIVLKNEWR
jgi:hypothetical protein